MAAPSYLACAAGLARSLFPSYHAQWGLPIGCVEGSGASRSHSEHNKASTSTFHGPWHPSMVWLGLSGWLAGWLAGRREEAGKWSFLDVCHPFLITLSRREKM